MWNHKNFDHSYLYVGLDYVDGVIGVDWNWIENLENSQLFVVTDSDGVVYVGSIIDVRGRRSWNYVIDDY